MQLSIAGLRDRYELKARLLPSLLATIPVCLALAPLGVSPFDWYETLLTAGGIWLVASIGLTYFAAAAGLRYERKIYPNWPHGLPTHQWLLPDSARLSTQQRNLYYESMKQLLDLDLRSEFDSGDDQQIAKTIDDAVRNLRSRFRQHPDRGLLAKHNEDYGFVRNFAGMSLLWLSASTCAAAIGWYQFLNSSTKLAWALANSAVLVLASTLACKKREMVYQRGDRYAESFFSRLSEESPCQI